MTGGSGFVFRTEAASAYARVDRMGEPAVATILVSSSMKVPFNDDDVSADAKYVSEFSSTLTTIANQLKNEWPALGYPICAVPK